MSTRRMPPEAVLQREREALELRRAGVIYDVIANRLGYRNKGSAYKVVQRALTRTLQEPAAELRLLEVDRLDRLQTALWREAMNGSVAAVDRILRIAERRARLLGLDAATPVDVTTDGNLIVQIGIPRPDWEATETDGVRL